LVVVALLAGALGPRGEVVHAATYRYDAAENARHGVNEVDAIGARSTTLASDESEGSASQSAQARGTSTTPSVAVDATNTVDDLLALPDARQVDAAWGANTYRHGGTMSTIEHINYRHAWNSGFENVSRFADGTSARQI
jgi:hypothetical protein